MDPNHWDRAEDVLPETMYGDPDDQDRYCEWEAAELEDQLDELFRRADAELRRAA